MLAQMVARRCKLFYLLLYLTYDLKQPFSFTNDRPPDIKTA
jgi:hypothetical protein